MTDRDRPELFVQYGLGFLNGNIMAEFRLQDADGKIYKRWVWGLSKTSSTEWPEFKMLRDGTESANVVPSDSLARAISELNSLRLQLEWLGVPR